MSRGRRKSAIKKIAALVVFFLFTIPVLSVFSQQINTAWVRRYNGPGNANDSAVAIAVDSGGNVYVTGCSFASATGLDYCTIKYLPNGDTAWVRRYSDSKKYDELPRAIVLDPWGSVYVTGRGYGFGSTSYLTIKYDTDGNQLWVREFPSQIFAGDGAYALAVDKNKNIYVTGASGETETREWLTVKYDSLGNEVWQRSFINGWAALALVVDSEGNVYVTGIGGTIKYDSMGNQLWIRSFAGKALGLDPNNNLFVISSDSTVKYDSDGNHLWAVYFTPGFFGGMATALAVDTVGNAYVTGWTNDVEAIEWRTYKYDSLGNETFLGFGGNLTFSENPRAITADDSGNVYVTGMGSGDCWTQKLGTLPWSKHFPASPLVENYGLDQANAIALDSAGNVYITGFSPGNGTGNDFVTIKYTPFPVLKGDLNLDGILSSADVVLALNCIFLEEAIPAGQAACDLDCNGSETPADAVLLLLSVFASQPLPCQ